MAKTNFFDKPRTEAQKQSWRIQHARRAGKMVRQFEKELREGGRILDYTSIVTGNRRVVFRPLTHEDRVDTLNHISTWKKHAERWASA